MVKSREYIGKIVKVRLPYFDVSLNKVNFKIRPAVVIAVESDNLPCDFTILPISSISRKENISPYYDIPINNYNKFNLKNLSYVRCHKIATTHSTNIDRKIISDLKLLDLSLYHNLIQKYKQFSDNIINQN